MKNEFPVWEPQDLTWQQDAACLGWYDREGEDLFFPPDNPGGPKQGKGVSGERTRIKKAKTVCFLCPVKEQCLQYALDNDCSGLWGGTTDIERRRMKKVVLRLGWMKWNVKIHTTIAIQTTLKHAASTVMFT